MELTMRMVPPPVLSPTFVEDDFFICETILSIDMKHDEMRKGMVQA